MTYDLPAGSWVGVSHIWAGLKSNEPSCSQYSTSSKVKFKYNKVPNCKLGFGTSVLPWAFLSFHEIFLNIHYVLHTPFLSLSSLLGKCAFAHFHGALFCPLNMHQIHTTVIGSSMADLQDSQTRSLGPIGTRHIGPACLASSPWQR